MSPLQQKAMAAIQAGRATSAQALADELGTDRKNANNVLSAMRRNGTVAYEMVNPRAIDWTTVRVVREQPAGPPVKQSPAPTSDRLLVDGAGLAELESLARQLVERLVAVRTAPSLATALAGLLGSVEPVQVARKAPTPKQVRRKAADPTTPRRKPGPKPKAKPVEDATPRYKTVAWNTGHDRGRDLAEFCTLADAEKALSIDLRAHKIVDLETGKVVKQKRSKLPPDPRQPADEEE